MAFAVRFEEYVELRIVEYPQLARSVMAPWLSPTKGVEAVSTICAQDEFTSLNSELESEKKHFGAPELLSIAGFPR